MSVLKIKKNGKWEAVGIGAQGPRGPKGEQGENGNPGTSIQSIERTAGTGTAGSTDTYTITLTDGSKFQFEVYNGKDGKSGSGAGDMSASTYDPQGKTTDIFAYIDRQIEQIPTPDVSGQINTHNSDASAHGDIRTAANDAAAAAETNAKNYTDQKLLQISTPDVSGQINVHNSDAGAHSDIRAAIPKSAADVGARPNTWTPTASDVGAVPTSRTVNGKALSANITLSASDVSARPDSWVPTASEVGARPDTWTPSKSDVGLGNVDNVKQYSASNPPPYPVTSVNGQTGDVNIDISGFIPNPASKEEGQVLTYNGVAWEARAAGGGISGAQYKVTIPATGWVQNGDYYTNTVSVEGIKGTYPVSPVVDVEVSGIDAAADTALIGAFGLISFINTAADSITAYCIGTPPEINVPIIINTWG